MKAVKPHTVMLSDAALKLIGDGTSGPIFPGSQSQESFGRHASATP